LYKKREETIINTFGEYNINPQIVKSNIEEIKNVIGKLSTANNSGDVRGETAAISRSDLGINAIQIFYDSDVGRFKVTDPDNAIYQAKEKGEVKIYSGIDSIYDPKRPRPISAIEYSVGEIVMADALRFERAKALGDLKLAEEDTLSYSMALKQGSKWGLELPWLLKAVFITS